MSRFDYRERACDWAIVDTQILEWVKEGLTEEEARTLSSLWNEVAEYIAENPAGESAFT